MNCQRVPVGPGQVLYVAVAAMVMGWSWSVYIAQTVLEDLLFNKAVWLTRQQQLSHHTAVPQLTPTQPVHWEYIDDYAVLALTKDSSREQPPKEAEVMKRALTQRGLPVHKEEGGSEFTSLGWTFTLEPTPIVEPDPQKLTRLALATTHLCTLRMVLVEWVETVVGT